MCGSRNIALEILTLWPTEGKKESIRSDLRVLIDLEATTYAASSGVDISTMGIGNDWAYVEFIAQQQQDTYNCGTSVLKAFFRTVVSLVLRHAPTQDNTSTRWYRKEILHLLTDGFEDDEDSK